MTLILAGRYDPGEILTGPDKAARRLFEAHRRGGGEAAFVEYIGRSDGAGLAGKIFARESPTFLAGITFLRAGVLPLLLLVRRTRGGVLHLLQFDRAMALTSLLRRRKGPRLVYTVHGLVRHEEIHLPRHASFRLRMKDRIAERLLFRGADRLVFVSELARAVARRYYSFPEEKSAVIPNGIDPEFRIPRVRTRSAGTPLRVVVNGSPARPGDRTELLLQALGSMGKEMELYFLHDGSSTGSTEAPAHIRIAKLPRMPTVDLPAFYADKDVFVSIKSWDSFSIASAEAMAAGLVPILSPETGMAQYIENGVNGFVVDPRDRQGLAGCVEKLWNDPAVCEEISGRARRIAETLTWEKTGEEYRKLYRELDPTSA